MCINYRAIIQAGIYSTLGNNYFEEIETQQLSDKQLKYYGLDFWLTQEMKISVEEFSDTFQRNDLDLIITWIKFFGDDDSMS